jgi:hypothetical protein
VDASVREKTGPSQVAPSQRTKKRARGGEVKRGGVEHGGEHGGDDDDDDDDEGAGSTGVAGKPAEVVASAGEASAPQAVNLAVDGMVKRVARRRCLPEDDEAGELVNKHARHKTP